MGGVNSAKEEFHNGDDIWPDWNGKDQELI